MKTRNGCRIPRKAVGVDARGAQERLALLAGLDRSYLGLIERGRRNITLGNIEKIARMLGVSIAALMKGV